MLSSRLGVRSVDMGIVQLGMHSMRGTTGLLDPGLGIAMFETFFREFGDVDAMLPVD